MDVEGTIDGATLRHRLRILMARDSVGARYARMHARMHACMHAGMKDEFSWRETAWAQGMNAWRETAYVLAKACMQGA